MDIICEIQQKYMLFSDKEKAIADYILSQPNMIKNTNIIDLANLIGTSGATITRFTKKVGCENYVELKMKINTTIRERIAQDTGIFANVYHHYQEVVERTNALVNQEAILTVVNEIKKAHKIYIYGVGSSGLSVSELMQRLLRMGFNVYGTSDPHMLIINSSIVTPQDLAIGLSISGETSEVVNSLRMCRDRGAKTISLTAFNKSPITEYSDLTLSVYDTRFTGPHKFINSQFSMMYLVDLISTVLLEDEELSTNMQMTVEAILNA